MTSSTNLDITYLEQNMASKEILINEGFLKLDSLLNTAVKNITTATPPGSPAEGDLYIVAASPTGAWSGKAGKLAYYASTWRFITPKTGMTVWVENLSKQYVYYGGSWQSVSPMIASTYDPANIAQQLVGTTASQTLTNKTLTSPVLNTGVSGSAISTDGTFAANSDTLIPSQKAVKTYVGAATGGWNFVKKTSDESMTSSTTIIADAALNFQMVASTKYAFRLSAYIECGASGGFRGGISENGLSTFMRFNTRVQTGTSTVMSFDSNNNVNTYASTSAGPKHLLIDGVVYCGGTGGGFYLGWSQNVSNATATIVKAGSYLEYRVI